MRARLTMIATAAGLAVAVFLAGALGPGGSSASRDPDRGPALDATIASLESRLAAAPDDWEASAALGLAYVQQVRDTSDPSIYPLAEAALDRSLTLRPTDNPDAFLGIGTLAAERHDFGLALRWARRAVEAAPFDADAYGLLGDAQLELGRYGAAIRTFQRMVDIRPNLASYGRVSYALELLGNTEGASAAMHAAYDVAAGPSDTAWAAAHIARFHFEAGRIREARQWFRRARAADPASADVQAGLARVAWASGDLEEAIARSERLATRSPAPDHIAGLADLYAAAGDHEAAAAQYDLVRVEARHYRENGVDTDLEMALFEADQAVSGSARGAESARAALRAARSEWSRRQSVHVADALAWALYANGQYRRASDLSSEALRLGTRDALFLFHAGMIRLRLGDEHGATSLLREASDSDPYFSVRWSPVLRDTLAGLRDG
ncbi:MAG TPA: tetratricopeptide repeat protein [Actinomycetota bacterium]|nr:tetratricopeptide repeat protein [Actinomycetota bacterium]